MTSSAAAAGGGLLLLRFGLLLFLLSRLAGAYDSIDPVGNIAIKWDFQVLRDDGYTVMVNIYNNQLYRHVESPGWKFGWKWAGDEVIWDMRGAEATEQGNCSRIKGGNVPHSCEQRPVIVDLPPGTPYNFQTRNCCRGGVLSSLSQGRAESMSSFQMSVGSVLNLSDPLIGRPSEFSLGLPGYTCSNATDVKPSKSLSADGRRYTQALLTWEVICSYSQFKGSDKPICCVSMSSFYDDTIIPCHSCSCGCQRSPGASRCVTDDEKLGTVLLPEVKRGLPPTIVKCTNHMCPIRVHWHVKLSYKAYWRVKVTINNFNVVKNYSDWNLVMRHPNFRSINQIFSFNYRPLMTYGAINDTAMFWGVRYYNDMLLSYGEGGNAQSEMLLDKDPGTFTFRAGWAFPQRVLFNGHECVMPPPDVYPSLPNGSPGAPALLRRLPTGIAPLLLFTVLQFFQ